MSQVPPEIIEALQLATDYDEDWEKTVRNCGPNYAVHGTMLEERLDKIAALLRNHVDAHDESHGGQ
jgi:hypothetical protein